MVSKITYKNVAQGHCCKRAIQRHCNNVIRGNFQCDIIKSLRCKIVVQVVTQKGRLVGFLRFTAVRIKRLITVVKNLEI
jgi:hypothetical protein